MTSPPPAPPGTAGTAARPGAPRAPACRRGPGPAGLAGVTRIVQTDELPPGVDALASADGRMIMVRASLDRAARSRALREVMATLRRFPRLALIPAITTEGARQALRRLYGALTGLSQNAAQLAATAGDHLGAATVAATAAAGVAAATVVMVTAAPDAAGPGAGGRRPARPPPWPAGPPRNRAPGARRPAGRAAALSRGLCPRRARQRRGPQPVRGHRGRQPNVALYYSSWNERFQLGFARQAYSDGATPAVQIEPFGISLDAIAAGRYDGYLRRYARQVASYGHPVIIGFAHEPDGGWYPWGVRNCPPATWVAAWRQVVTVFRAAGAGNVIWLWTMNAQGADAAAMAQWWPGAGLRDLDRYRRLLRPSGGHVPQRVRDGPGCDRRASACRC